MSFVRERESLREAARSFAAHDTAQTEAALFQAAVAYAAKAYEAVLARNPLDRKSKCVSCGKMSRVTTAGCDHCDYEDK